MSKFSGNCSRPATEKQDRRPIGKLAALLHRSWGALKPLRGIPRCCGEWRRHAFAQTTRHLQIPPATSHVHRSTFMCSNSAQLACSRWGGMCNAEVRDLKVYVDAPSLPTPPDISIDRKTTAIDTLHSHPSPATQPAQTFMRWYPGHCWCYPIQLR